MKLVREKLIRWFGVPPLGGPDVGAVPPEGGTPNEVSRRLRIPGFRRGMTLLELLIVISIIALLSLIALPALKGMREANVINWANRQLLDDLGFARQQAIKNRAPVCVVFAPPIQGGTGPRYGRETLIRGQCRMYRIYALRSIGDQPGQPNSRYLTGWKELPEGVIIAPPKFGGFGTSDPMVYRLPWVDPSTTPPGVHYEILSFARGRGGVAAPGNYKWDAFPHPTSTNTTQMDQVELPYILFDSQGRLRPYRGDGSYYIEGDCNQSGNCIIPLTRGSVLPERQGTNYMWQLADIRERPPGAWSNNFNFIVIDGLTGRARVKRPEVQ